MGKALLIVGILRNLDNMRVWISDRAPRHGSARERFENTTEGRAGSHGEVLLLGIDGFKNINILNSHSFGDFVLRTTAQDILKLIPEQVKLYRYDGDQFLLYGNNVRREEMLRIYEDIRKYASVPSGKRLFLSVHGVRRQLPIGGSAQLGELEKAKCAA
ncbi:MAG: diguanylate cyclase domain-containing protein [Eisenbergiella sp.]